jgi:ABC-type multidrug transport system permease subunit
LVNTEDAAAAAAAAALGEAHHLRDETPEAARSPRDGADDEIAAAVGHDAGGAHPAPVQAATVVAGWAASGIASAASRASRSLSKRSRASSSGGDAEQPLSSQPSPAETARVVRVERLADHFAASDECASSMREPPSMPPAISLRSLDGGGASGTGSGGGGGGGGGGDCCCGGGSGKFPTPWRNQLAVLFKRSFFHKLRDPLAVATQFLNAVLLPIVIGSIYWQIGLDQRSVNDRVAALSFLVLCQTFMALDTIVIWPTERAVYLRDQAAGMYSSSAFYMGRTLSELPFHLLFGALAGVISYEMFGLQHDASKFGNYVLNVTLVTQCGVSVLLAVSSMSKNMEMGNAIGTLVLIFLTLFDGFYVNKQNVPRAYRWLESLSFLGLGVEVAVANEFRGLNFTCTPQDVSTGLCVRRGEDKLVQLGFDHVDIPTNMWKMAGMIIGYRFVSYLGLRFFFTGQSLRQRIAAG